MRDAFQHRWLKHFGHEDWWERIDAVLEGPAHDWDDGGGLRRGIEQLAYETAKNRGIDTTQECPHCGQLVDQPGCIEDESWAWCEDCQFVAEWREEKEEERARTAKLWAEVRQLAYLQSLTPEERERVERERMIAIKCMHAGLVRRDVQ